ncbi:crotonobetainyl-CoA:carnitine CoA-transferase CaiB-like acyl-CoA transferase [Sagittula marina]|uniref:Crotonobetainyl-CoA:carnitine CoA-transferase CaiB-like acyl-CoA transferase n=1 Tax=Sagittula marina TaxID=943940 RepID=A0A7W6GT53_9RHOB|nr:CaiB/BaiF CoA-transferase family protein [Sagittula marina]MBB3986720.1 crotonobetainyl-CoA:carnitine CoA-transferase CaiB-like acyl-CoA transferase [Sagittula marina]
MSEHNWHTRDFDADATGPMTGVRVLDLSRLVAGNMCSLQLADFGADVVKVEPQPVGDPLRAWKQQGQSTFWKTYGRNKRSIALDFRADGGLEVLERLMAQADVMIESFRPGTMEKMGLGPDVLEKRFPQLILLRVSGFGQTGPYSPRPGFGTLVEGMSGFAHRNGEEGGDPLLPPLALADMIAGLYGSNAIMMALRSREQTGRGQVVDLSLLEAMVSVLGPEPLDYRLTGAPKPRVGNGSNTSSPRNVYHSKDGHYIAVSASVQNAATRMFNTIGRPDMNTDPRFSTNEERIKRREEVDEIVGSWMAKHTRDELLEIFERDGITAAPLYSIADIAEDRHFIDREIFVEVPDAELDSVPMHSPLPRMSATPGTLRCPAPSLGEHGRSILAEAGYEAEEIDDMVAAGLIAVPDEEVTQ